MGNYGKLIHCTSGVFAHKWFFCRTFGPETLIGVPVFRLHQRSKTSSFFCLGFRKWLFVCWAFLSFFAFAFISYQKHVNFSCFFLCPKKGHKQSEIFWQFAIWREIQYKAFDIFPQKFLLFERLILYSRNKNIFDVDWLRFSVSQPSDIFATKNNLRLCRSQRSRKFTLNWLPKTRVLISVEGTRSTQWGGAVNDNGRVCHFLKL